MNDTTTPADAAERAREGFANMKADITADRSLSATGKAERLAAARDTTNAAIDQIQADAQAALASERASLESNLLAAPSPSLGATPTDRIAQTASYRDAVSRAGMTATPGELVDLQRTALLTGDTLLARATLVVGLQRGDPETVNAYVAANPKLGADVERLWNLTHAQRSTVDLWAEAITFAKVR